MGFVLILYFPVTPKQLVLSLIVGVKIYLDWKKKKKRKPLK